MHVKQVVGFLWFSGGYVVQGHTTVECVTGGVANCDVDAHGDIRYGDFSFLARDEPARRNGDSVRHGGAQRVRIGGIRHVCTLSVRERPAGKRDGRHLEALCAAGYGLAGMAGLA